MRLIDADAFMEELDEYIDDCELGISDIKELINNAPTEPQVTVFAENASKEEIEDFKQELENVLEEKPQGKWIIDGHHIRCNRCNEYICNTDREGSKIPDSFCPNCGARMQKECSE